MLKYKWASETGIYFLKSMFCGITAEEEPTID